MKNIIKLLSISVAVLLSLASCSEVLTKSEVEAKWNTNSANIPTVTLGELSLQGKGQDVVVTGSTISSSGAILEAGIQFCASEDFNPSSTTYIVVEDVTTFGSVVTKLGAATTYYVRAYGIVGEGMAYSEVKTITTKDLPLIDKVCGTFSGTVVSGAFGDVYTSTLVIEPGQEENTVVIYNIDPYWAAEGYVKGSGYNFVVGTLDEATSSISVAIGANANLDGRMIVGFNAAAYSDATAYQALTFVSKAGGAELYQANGFFTVKSDGRSEDAYNGGVTFKKK